MTKKEKAAFAAGYVMACCNMVNMHHQDSVASDVLAEISVTQAEIDAMDLSEYDADALAKIRAARSRDPIINT